MSKANIPGYVPNAGSEPNPAKSNLAFEPAPVKSIVPVPDTLEEPVKLKFEAEDAVAPKETAVAPKVSELFDKDELGILPTDNSILLFVIAVVTPVPPVISKLSPKPTSKLVEESSPILIDEFAKLAFVMPAVPDKLVFVKPDIDGGLIGGASLVADDFLAIINSF